MTIRRCASPSGSPGWRRCHIDQRFLPSVTRSGSIRTLSLHCLRHSYVTHLIEFGYPERFVQDQVGHAYASTTALYTSVSNS